MKYFTILMLILLVVGLVQASIIFEDDFEGQAVGSAPGAPWDSATGAVVLEDDGTVFGTPNKYVQHTDTSTTASSYLRDNDFTPISGSFGTLSFDMYEPTDATFKDGYVIRLGISNSGSTGTAVDLRFDDGKVSTSGGTSQSVSNAYMLDTAYHVDVVVNLTGSDANYFTGESLPNGRYDVWMDGVRIIDDAEFNLATLTTISNINITTFSGYISQMNLDNVVLRDEAYVSMPYVARNPSPAIGQEGVAIDAPLSWDICEDPNLSSHVTEYQVYLQKGDPNMSSVTPAVYSETGSGGGTHAPAADLDRDSVYYWRVDQKTDTGEIVKGLTWNFSTELSIPSIDQQPVDVLIAETEEAEFAVGATNPFTGDSSGISYKWMYSADGITYSTTGTDANTLSAADEGYYYCNVKIVSNGIGTIDGSDLDSEPAKLAVKRLVANWTMDMADYVGGQLLDIVGGNNADPNSPPIFVTGAGPDTPADGAVTINPDSFAYAGTWNPSELSGQITVSTWIYWDGSALGTNGNTIIAKRDSWGPDTMMWHLGIRDIDEITGKAEVRFYNNSTMSVFSTGIIEANTWMHVCGVFGDSQARIYVNGELKNTDSNAALGTGFDSQITLGAVGNDIFPGALDDIKFHNYALNNEEVAELYYGVSKQSVCLYPPATDYNGDCLVNLDDFAIFAEKWLDSGLYPSGQ